MDSGADPHMQAAYGGVNDSKASESRKHDVAELKKDECWRTLYTHSKTQILRSEEVPPVWLAAK